MNLDNPWKPPVAIATVKDPRAIVPKSVERKPVVFKTPGRPTIPKPTYSQTEPRPGPQSRYITIGLKKDSDLFLYIFESKHIQFSERTRSMLANPVNPSALIIVLNIASYL